MFASRCWSRMLGLLNHINELDGQSGKERNLWRQTMSVSSTKIPRCRNVSNETVYGRFDDKRTACKAGIASSGARSTGEEPRPSTSFPTNCKYVNLGNELNGCKLRTEALF